jgi:hypothetical protein
MGRHGHGVGQHSREANPMRKREAFTNWWLKDKMNNPVHEQDENL